MKKTTVTIIVIVVVAVLAVLGAVAFFVSDTFGFGEEPTTHSSELVDPTGNAEDVNENTSETAQTTTLASAALPKLEMPEQKPGEVEIPEAPSVLDIDKIAVEDRTLLLINKNYALPDAYIPYLEEAVADSGVYLESAAAKAYAEMYADALEQGLTLTPVSGYCSKDRQAIRFEAISDLYKEMGYSQEEADALTGFKVLPPGCSEHNAGLAVDICKEDASFAESLEYIWLLRNAASYGFVERYKADKQSITGVEAKPWHWRYVGSAETAKSIQENGLCLEEWKDIIYPTWVPSEDVSDEADLSDVSQATEESGNTEAADTTETVVELM